MANPTYRSSNSAADQTGSTDFTVTAPAGVADGDMLYFFQLQDGHSTPSLPTGFHSDKIQSFASGVIIYTAYKIAASEPASYTFHNFNSADISSVYLLAIQNPTGTTPEGGSKASGTSTLADPGTYTTLADSDLILTGWASLSASSINPAGSYTALGLIGVTASLNVGYKTQPSAGVVNNRTAALGVSAAWGAILGAIQAPAAAAYLPYDIPHSPGFQGIVTR